MAFRTGLLDREKALLHAHLSVAVTRRTGDRRGTGACAIAVTGVANFHGRDANLGFRPPRGLFERDFQVIAQIRAAMDIAVAASGIKKIVEYVAERIAKTTSAWTHARINSRVAMLIIRSPFSRVGKDFVRFLGLLEALLRFWIIRIAIRMVFHRKLAIGLLDILLIAVAVDAQYLVVIA